MNKLIDLQYYYQGKVPQLQVEEKKATGLEEARVRGLKGHMSDRRGSSRLRSTTSKKKTVLGRTLRVTPRIWQIES